VKPAVSALRRFERHNSCAPRIRVSVIPGPHAALRAVLVFLLVSAPVQPKKHGEVTARSDWFTMQVVLAPCPHASGQEAELARSFDQVDRVHEPSSLWSLLLLGRTSPVERFASNGVVVFLGGESPSLRAHTLSACARAIAAADRLCAATSRGTGVPSLPHT
jgi:hypothetical protein